jgi:hypothetical protein
LAREINPRLVYERLLRAGQQTSSSAQRESALLDLVLGDAKRVRGWLGASDRQKLDEYLDSVRSVEERLDRLAQDEQVRWAPRADVAANSAPADMPEEKPERHAERVELMLDMVALAFQSDMTRVCTFMFGNSVSNINFSFLEGVRDAHHSLSHHAGDAEKLRQYQLIARWHVEQYARLLRKLKEMKEGEASVLENSLILFGSSLRDGNSHDPHNLPLVLAGRAGGRIRTGQHFVYEQDTPLANLYVSMLAALGAPVDKFADSTGPLPGVLA